MPGKCIGNALIAFVLPPIMGGSGPLHSISQLWGGTRDSPTQSGCARELLWAGLQWDLQGGRRELDGSHRETKAWDWSEKGCGADREGHGVGLGGLWAVSQGGAASRSSQRFGSIAGGFTAQL